MRIALTLALVLSFAGPAGIARAIATVPSTEVPYQNVNSPNGGTVAAGGDLNGDGYSDMVVARLGGITPPSVHTTAEIRVYLGSANGSHTTADWSITCDELLMACLDYFGASLAAGDVNGDGFDDLIVGTQYLGVLVWLGDSQFASRPPGTPDNADWQALGSDYGYGVAAGDLDDDGKAEIVSTVTSANGLIVWRGSATLATDPDGTAANAVWSAAGVNDGAVSASGDVNGDGFADILSGYAGDDYLYPQGPRGAVFVFHGRADLTALPNPGSAATANRKIAGANHGDYFGITVAHAGDVGGDVDGSSCGDILVTSLGFVTGPYWEVWGGQVAGGTVYYTALVHQALASPWRVSPAGDVNGDSFADIVAFSTVGGFLGTRVYLGGDGTGPSGAAGPDGTPDAEFFWGPPLPAGTRLTSVVGVGNVGDVNGDGYSDVGAIQNPFPSSTPFIPGWGLRAVVFHGAGNPTDNLHTFKPATFYYGQNGGGYGLSFSAAGDINADGFGDYVIGQPNWDGGAQTDEGRFEPVFGGPCGPYCGPPLSWPTDAWESNQDGAQQGWSVAGAGDLNGDGFDDVVVGAPEWDSPGVTAGGRIQFYLGGASGLAVTPSFTVENSNGAGARLGFWVSGAGDVNGDGRGDVLVSAPYATVGGISEAGAVYLYLGAATPQGVNPTPAWTKSGTSSFQHFGIRTATAGDVDRDGRSDVLIASLNAGPAGEVAAYVFHGRAGGLAATPTTTLVGETLADDYSVSIGSAGDVNGDRYADVVFGEPLWNGVGRIRVFHGSSGGVGTTAQTTVSGGISGSRFGSGVGGGGDVDGDGFGDVVVGAQWYTNTVPADGKAFVFTGSSSGLSAAASVVLPGTPGDNSDYGRDVALNVDVNGDGFADVLVGAIGAQSFGVDGGMVFGYFGNAGGVGRRPRMQTFAGARLALLANVAPGDAPQLRLANTLRSAGGRMWMRADFEVKPIDQAFDGTSLISSLLVQTTLLGGADVLVSAACTSAKGCHWRARQSARHPYYPRTPWISPWGNTPTETDVRAFVDPETDGVSQLADVCPLVADPLQLNEDHDGFGDACDNCGSIANDDQADGDADLVGNVCDNCSALANPRVGASAAAYLAANPWATLTGGQRDDDHDGYGNKCDADFTPTSALVGTADLTQFRASNSKSRQVDTCGTSGLRPCAIFDLDEVSTLIGTGDLTQFRLLSGKAAGPKCTACPLPCSFGTAGTCGPVPN